MDKGPRTVLGWVDSVRAGISARSEVREVLGPHGIDLIAHARAGGPEAQSVVDLLEQCSQT